MDGKERMKRPTPDEFDLQPYGYINALTNYIDSLEKIMFSLSGSNDFCKECKSANPKISKELIKFCGLCGNVNK